MIEHVEVGRGDRVPSPGRQRVLVFEERRQFRVPVPSAPRVSAPVKARLHSARNALGEAGLDVRVPEVVLRSRAGLDVLPGIVVPDRLLVRDLGFITIVQRDWGSLLAKESAYISFFPAVLFPLLRFAQETRSSCRRIAPPPRALLPRPRRLSAPSCACSCPCSCPCVRLGVRVRVRVSEVRRCAARRTLLKVALARGLPAPRRRRTDAARARGWRP